MGMDQNEGTLNLGLMLNTTFFWPTAKCWESTSADLARMADLSLLSPQVPQKQGKQGKQGEGQAQAWPLLSRSSEGSVWGLYIPYEMRLNDIEWGEELPPRASQPHRKLISNLQILVICLR
jgi:hypothetical protein